MDNCSVCERPLTVEGFGGKLIGVCITIECPAEEHRVAFEKAMYPYDIDKTYSVCFPCWLLSLGVKP